MLKGFKEYIKKIYGDEFFDHFEVTTIGKVDEDNLEDNQYNIDE